MTRVRVDSKYRVLLDRNIRSVMNVRKNDRLVAFPFYKGVILVAAESKSFAESLKGFRYVESEHEASKFIKRRIERHARS